MARVIDTLSRVMDALARVIDALSRVMERLPRVIAPLPRVIVMIFIDLRHLGKFPRFHSNHLNHPPFWFCDFVFVGEHLRVLPFSGGHIGPPLQRIYFKYTTLFVTDLLQLLTDYYHAAIWSTQSVVPMNQVSSPIGGLYFMYKSSTTPKSGCRENTNLLPNELKAGRPTVING